MRPSADGRSLLATVAGRCECWDLARGVLFAERQLRGLIRITGVVWPATGHEAIAATGDGLYGLDFDLGHDRPRPIGPARECRGVAWVEADRMIVTGRGAQVSLWDVHAGEEVAAFEGHTRRVLAVAVAPDGRIASGGVDGELRLWDRHLGEELACFPGTAPVWGLAFSPSVQRLASVGESGLVVWDLPTGLAVRAHEVPAGASGVAWSADGARLAVGARDGRVLVWSA